MDITVFGTKAADLFKKYKYVVLVVVIGIGLMLIPMKSGDTKPTEIHTEETPKTNMAQELEQILTQVKGAGKVRVFLSCASGERTIYQTDSDTSTAADTGSVRTETVIVTGSDRNQQALIQQVLSPEYLGAVVVCQGAEDAAVRLAIVDAVSDVTGISSDRISVLKMK